MHRFAKIITAVFALIAGIAFGESTKPYSPDYPALERLTADSLQKMGLEDEMLAMAYAEVFILNFDRVDDPPEWVVAAKNDLIRRGNSAAPLLLRMFEAHPLQQYREELLKKIEDFASIDIRPFVDVARAYWEKNKNNTPPRTCYAIAKILSRHGEMKDLADLDEMLRHPSKEVGFVIQPDIERMSKRLDGTLQPNEWIGPPPSGYQWPKKSSVQPAPQPTPVSPR